jgi:DeoR family galactitol utilization operon repressor
MERRPKLKLHRAERERYILDRLAADGSLNVSQLARVLDVSEVTIRAQLRELESRGLLTRTHGGAKPTSVANVLERQLEREAEKRRIAQQAAELVRDGDYIMIEAGTTTSGIVRHLTARRDVQIVTNSTLVFGHARHNNALSVILTGGTFHRPSESLVGPIAIRTLRDFHVRIAFVGTDGLTRARGLTTQFAEGADVIAAMQAQADETWLVADSSKFGKSGFVHVLAMEQLTGIITDTGLGPEHRDEVTAAGIELRLA